MSAAPRHFAVVVNPRAGRAAQLWPQLQRELEARAISHHVLHAATGEDALALLRREPPEIAVITLGGDGTAGALLPDIVEKGRPLLALAGGTGNDFAQTLGRRVGAWDILDSWNAEPVGVDAIRVRYSNTQADEAMHERLMLNGGGMGFDAQLTANMPRVSPRLTGLTRYLAAALLTLREMTPATVQVSADGREVYGGPAMLCAVLNGRSVGGGFQFAPAAEVTDDLLDIVLAGEVSRAGVLPLIGQVLARRHLTHPQVWHVPARTAELRWGEPVHLHLDGDVVGRFDWLRAEVLAGAVPLLGGVGALKIEDNASFH